MEERGGKGIGKSPKALELGSPEEQPRYVYDALPTRLLAPTSFKDLRFIEIGQLVDKKRKSGKGLRKVHELGLKLGSPEEHPRYALMRCPLGYQC